MRTITNRENRSYELTEYDDSWASKYNEYKAMVSGLLGDNMTFIDHVGSTAVPGMLAKPIIDIAVRVKDLDAVRGKVNEFLGSGFAYHADFIGKGDEYFTLDHDAKRVLNLHIFADDNPYPLELVAMRDYLIENKVRRDQYCHEKRRIFELYGGHDYNSYASEKKAMTDNIREEAVRWSATRC